MRIKTIFCAVAIGVSACMRADDAGIDAKVQEFLNRPSFRETTLILAISVQPLPYEQGQPVKIVYAKVYGKQVPGVTVDTTMRIASVTKPFTKMAIMKLIDTGRLSLYTKFYDVLQGEPWFPTQLRDERYKLVTIQQLLDHTSGIGAAHNFMFQMIYFAGQLQLPLDQIITPAQLAKYIFENYSLARQPGASYEYSNFGYSILGRVIEAVTRQSYVDYLRSILPRLTTLGLAQTGIDGMAAPQPGEISQYLNPNDNSYGYWVQTMDSHGGLLMSAKDLCQYMADYWLDTGLDRSKNPVRSGDIGFLGSLPTTMAAAYQNPARRVNIAVLINGRGTDAVVHAEDLDAFGKIPRSIAASRAIW